MARIARGMAALAALAVVGLAATEAEAGVTLIESVSGTALSGTLHEDIPLDPSAFQSDRFAVTFTASPATYVDEFVVQGQLNACTLPDPAATECSGPEYGELALAGLGNRLLGSATLTGAFGQNYVVGDTYYYWSNFDVYLVSDENYQPPFSFEFDIYSLPAVPEPTTWMLAILGLGLTGASMRQRRAPTVQF